MGRNASPAREGAVALDVLEELGQEVEEAVEAGIQQGACHVGRVARRVGQQAKRENRLRHPALVVEEVGKDGHPSEREPRATPGSSIPSTRPRPGPARRR